MITFAVIVGLASPVVAARVVVVVVFVVAVGIRVDGEPVVGLGRGFGLEVGIGARVGDKAIDATQ